MNPRKPALSRPVALRLAATEYDRCADVFSSLEPAHWTAQTDCPAWDVRQMAAHMLGMVEMAASMRENLRQQRLAKRAAGQGGATYIDALTQVQVDERADWTPDRITRRFRTWTAGENGPALTWMPSTSAGPWPGGRPTSASVTS